MPDTSVRKYFRKSKPYDAITFDEFSDMMRKLSKKANKKKQNKTALDARLVNATEEQYEITN